MESVECTAYGQCRCCLLMGYHRDVMKIYHTNGVREVYFDMFLDCFNLFLATTSELSTLICMPCIQKLRNANEFKAMVVQSEQRLLSTTDNKDTLFINVPQSDVKTETEIVQIKLEQDHDNVDIDDNYLEHDDPEPTRPEYLVEGEMELLSRSHPVRPLPTADTLHSVSPLFAHHLMLLRGKTVLPKSIEKLLNVSEFQTKIGFIKKNYTSEKVALIKNCAVLLENSNATPFKSRNRAGFPCFYCRSTFDNLESMREHQTRLHKKSDLVKLFGTYGPEALVIYADITDLKCSICDQSLPNLNELKSHLIKTHKKKYHADISDRVIPFKLSEDNIFECQVCGFSYETFGSVERHMNVHYRNYVCRECGTGFVTKYRLKVHTKSMHVEGSFTCESCKKVFRSQQKLKNHVATVHKLIKRFKCPKCLERFSEYFQRQKHMVTVHGVTPLRYKCNVCDKTFERRYTLSRHMKRDHLEERDYQCDKCVYKCFTNNELRVHMIKHNGERIYECGVCKKAYARKKTLREHMRIHNNDRRFACAVCGQAFVQKCSLKGHMKTHHLEYSMRL